MTFVAAGVVPPAGRMLDLGSGGGIPGLVLANALPASTWVLLDGSERRTAFLGEAVDELGLGDRVSVLTARAEEAGRDPRYRGQFDAVVARSFGPPPAVAECGAPFLRLGGALLVSEPPEVIPGDRWPPEALDVVGLVPERRVEHPFGVQVLIQRTPCAETYPRRWAQQRRTPLFDVPRETDG